MKKILLLTSLAIASLLLTNCKKNNQEMPSPSNEKYQFNLSIENLPGQPNVLDGLSAVVSVQTTTGQFVIENKIVALNYDGKYISEPIMLPLGNYKLVKLILQRQSATLFASPLAGSAMAPQVNKPLATDFTVSKSINTLNTEVLMIGANHRPEDFGYAGNIFNFPQGNQTDFELHLKPIFMVGKIVYDSVPAAVAITTYPLQGVPTTHIHQVAAGGQKFTLSKNAVKYKLRVSKWGMNDEIELEQTDMKSQELYIGGANKVAKKIKSETVFLLSGDKWLPQTRKEYTYNTLGLVTRITHLSKAANGTNIVDGAEEFIYYANNKVKEIHYNVNGNSKITYFSYKADGKIDQMKESSTDGDITAIVSYLGTNGHTGITNNYQVGATYEFSNRYYKQYVSSDMVGGNAINYSNHTSHGDSEETTTSYDFGINPYAHLAIPDFWLRETSKHNKVNKWTQYVTNIPRHDAYKFSYTYDSEGFPTEMITKYRFSNTVTEAFTTKTSFTY